MFEIRKEVVNSIGNVQRSEQIGFVDCTKDELISSLSINYYNLARADTLYYKLRGQSYTVRYVFIYKSLATIADAITHAKADIKARVAEANEYIKTANAAYKNSQKLRGHKDRSMLIKPVDVKDFMWNDKTGVIEDGHVMVVIEN